jgi:integrase
MATMRRNKSGLPKHCGWNTDHHGKRRVRFRKDGFSTYLNGTPWSEAFMRQYAAALDGLESKTGTVGAERTKPGTINALVVSYYALMFPLLKPSTQRMRRNILERFRREHGDKPVDRIEHEHVAAIIAAKANTPEAGNNLRKVLRHLFEHAVTIRMIKANPVQYVKKFKSTGDGIHTWSEEEVARFIERHPVGTKAYLAMMLMLYTGQRGRSDAARMGWQHVRGGKIAVRQEKTNTPLLIPIAPALMQALEALPRSNMTFLVTERGAPFTGPGFGNWFRDRCDEAELPQCSGHGLRKLAATRLAEAGCSERQIMAITGHKSVTEVSRYTKAAQQSRLAEQAMSKVLRGANSEQELSNLPTRLDKTAAK